MSDPLAVIARLPGVPEAVEEARQAVDRLYRHRVLRRAGPAVSAESSLRGARASAAIEGVDVPLDLLRQNAVDDPVVQGALRASVEVGRMGATWRRAPRQVLARLHTVAAAGLPADVSGVPGAGGVGAGGSGVGGSGRAGTLDGSVDGRSVDDGSVDDGPGVVGTGADESADVGSGGFAGVGLGRPRVRDEAPDPLGLGPAPGAREIAARMDSLFDLLGRPTKAPALVLAAVVHAELMVLRPFGTADGVVARAAERLTLVEYGLDPKSLAVVEVGHLESPYADGLRAYLTGTPEGVAEWVCQCAAAVTLGVRETTAVCEALQRG